MTVEYWLLECQLVWNTGCILELFNLNSSLHPQAMLSGTFSPSTCCHPGFCYTHTQKKRDISFWLEKQWFASFLTNFVYTSIYIYLCLKTVPNSSLSQTDLCQKCLYDFKGYRSKLPLVVTTLQNSSTAALALALWMVCDESINTMVLVLCGQNLPYCGGNLLHGSCANCVEVLMNRLQSM